MSAIGQLRVWLAEALDPLHTRVDSLEARVAALEERVSPASAAVQSASDRKAPLKAVKATPAKATGKAAPAKGFGDEYDPSADSPKA